MQKHFIMGSIIAIAMCSVSVLGFGFSPKTDNDSALTLERIFSQKEFEVKRFDYPSWMNDDSGYLILEDSEFSHGAKDIVCYNPETGTRQIIVSAGNLIPSDRTLPLKILNYSFSADNSKLLITTKVNDTLKNISQPEYWIVSRPDWKLRQIQVRDLPAPIMAIQFSPDDQKVGYISGNNLYIEMLLTSKRIQLTKDSSKTIINGDASTRFYNGLNTKGFRWSPDSEYIAYLQFDTQGVKEFLMINKTDSIYPNIISFQHVKPGEQLPLCRAGVVNVSGTETVWLKIPGDPRNNYITTVDWAENSEDIIVQQLNRLQNTIHIFMADAKTGETKSIMTESDDAWIESYDSQWIDDGKQFVWISERDGWWHIYLISRDGKSIKPLTPGPYGRAWRKIIYKKHGIFPSDDQAAAVCAIADRWSYVDSGRIGVYGWSGGGLMSLLLILRYPDLYQTAMAGAYLSNHRFYHAGFTERYLGLPQDNPEAYELTAAINYAHNLKGNLLLIHGTGDDNVHYQNTKALINKRIAEKKRFSVMVYPNRSHSMREEENTQYHLYDLYTWYLNQHMPAGQKIPEQ